MIERAEVEELLAMLEKVHKPNKGIIAELCRTWLAVEAAPEARISGEMELYALEPSDGDSYVAIGKLNGKRVRLVVAGEG